LIISFSAHLSPPISVLPFASLSPSLPYSSSCLSTWTTGVLNGSIGRRAAGTIENDERERERERELSTAGISPTAIARPRI